MAEDEGGHEHLLVLVLLDGDALPVVVDADLVLLAVDVHADGVHLGIADLRKRLGGGGGGKEPSCHDHPYLVVRGVDEDLIEDLGYRRPMTLSKGRFPSFVENRAQ